MTLYYGDNSKINLLSCDPKIQFIFKKILTLELIDVSIIQGHRGEAEQNRYFKLGKSQVQWPNSKHNFMPSRGVDAAPYVNGKASDDYRHCIYLAGIIMAISKYEGFRIRWGGNWDMDLEPVTDQDFQDLWHYELVGG